MKIFSCDDCGSPVFFENVSCLKCGHTLGFLPDLGEIKSLKQTDVDTWRICAKEPAGRLYRECRNRLQRGVCNWMVPAGDPNPYCESCRLNDLIPNLQVPGNLELWHLIEKAKRRLIYTLRELGLPTAGEPSENRPDLRFRFVGDVPGSPPLMTGHDNGIITINIAEADDAERERRRVSLHEPYRTLLGHLRHETAHYYWDRLIDRTPSLERFRELFGDETRDYAAALKEYYQKGPPNDWQSHYVSAYASAHPWEDWAETGAHYFHIVDTLETSGSFGLALHPRHPAAHTMTADPTPVGQGDLNFNTILKSWFPLTYALNSLNRGMGLQDLYPFVLASPAIEKLRFFHDTVQGNRSSCPA